MREKVKSILKENNIIFYEREFEKNIILLIPYELKKYKLHINIKMDIDDEKEMYTMRFDCDLNTEVDSKEKLLNMNAEFSTGTLSIAPNSNKVTYATCCLIKDDFSYATYQESLYRCFFVFLQLYRENIINREAYKIDESEE